MPHRFQHYASLVWLAAAWIGYFSPWVAPLPAALQLSAHDLVEWLTFMQTVRDGTFPVSRLDLLWPLAGLSLVTALFPSMLLSQAERPAWRQGLFVILALLAAYQILPAYPFVLTAYQDVELGPQFWLGVVTGLAALGLGGISLFFPQWSRPLAALLALASMVAALRAASLMLPPISDVLAKPAPPGYGMWLSALGFFGLAASAALAAVRQRPTQASGESAAS